MGVVEVLDPVAPTKAGGWKVDVSRGERNGRVSSEWFNRPDDERYLSLDELWASVKGRSERSRSRVVQTADRLPDGSPDLYFRGFYCWNSEVGAKTLGMASFYLRAACQNRNLWVRRVGAIN
jgi:hypothetical protein